MPFRSRASSPDSLRRLPRRVSSPRGWIFLLLLFGVSGQTAAQTPSDRRVETFGRVQTAFGVDSNPREELEPDSDASDGFSRLLLEGRIRSLSATPGRRTVTLDSRGFVERYLDLPAEARAQGEVRLLLDQPLRERRGGVEAEAGLRHRAYPDSTSREFQRVWGRLAASARFGRHGVVRPSFQIWRLDFAQTPRVDRRAYDVGLDYERTLRSNWTGHLGVAFERIRHGRPSLQLVDRGTGVAEPILGEDQSDSGRRIHLGARFARRVVFRTQVGYQSQSSNSLGASWRRWDVRWLAAGSLPHGVTAQCFGTLEKVHFVDDHLDDVFILRPGDELEANEDNNALVVGLTKGFASRLRAEVRFAWYRNESLLVGDFYDKRLWTVALGWESGASSF